MAAGTLRKKWLAKMRKLQTPKSKPEAEVLDESVKRKRKAAVLYSPDPVVAPKKIVAPKKNIKSPEKRMQKQWNFDVGVEKVKRQSKLSVGRFVEVAQVQRSLPPMKPTTRTRNAMVEEPPLWHAGQQFPIVSKTGVYYEVRIHAVGLCQKGGKKTGYYRVLIVQTTEDGISWSPFDMLDCYQVSCSLS
jgi:hypothetical protein